MWGGADAAWLDGEGGGGGWGGGENYDDDDDGYRYVWFCFPTGAFLPSLSPSLPPSRLLFSPF